MVRSSCSYLSCILFLCRLLIVLYAATAAAAAAAAAENSFSRACEQDIPSS